jgi:hypothetical protein
LSSGLLFFLLSFSVEEVEEEEEEEEEVEEEEDRRERSGLSSVSTSVKKHVILFALI